MIRNIKHYVGAKAAEYLLPYVLAKLPPKPPAPRGLLSTLALYELIDRGVIDAHHSQVTGTTIDVRLAPDILFESRNPGFARVVRMANGETIETEPHNLNNRPYKMSPGEFVLGSTIERFKLPASISAMYFLKSSQARSGQEHLGAGWIDPGFEGNLTLELVNCVQHHDHLLDSGMFIGQIMFIEHEPVEPEMLYSNRGQYHRQKGVTPSRGLRGGAFGDPFKGGWGRRYGY